MTDEAKKETTPKPAKTIKPAPKYKAKVVDFLAVVKAAADGDTSALACLAFERMAANALVASGACDVPGIVAEKVRG